MWPTGRRHGCFPSLPAKRARSYALLDVKLDRALAANSAPCLRCAPATSTPASRDPSAHFDHDAEAYAASEGEDQVLVKEAMTTPAITDGCQGGRAFVHDRLGRSSLSIDKLSGDSLVDQRGRLLGIISDGRRSSQTALARCRSCGHELVVAMVFSVHSTRGPLPHDRGSRSVAISRDMSALIPLTIRGTIDRNFICRSRSSDGETRHQADPRAASRGALVVMPDACGQS